jgi:PEP-CTERM motif
MPLPTGKTKISAHFLQCLYSLRIENMTIQKLAAALATAAAALLLATPAHAVLQDRDIDGNGQVDAFYDTDLNVTWLRDLKAVSGASYLNWYQAMAAADSYSIGNYADWRLPGNPTECYGSCQDTEIGHLLWNELAVYPANGYPGVNDYHHDFSPFLNAEDYMFLWTSTTNSLSNDQYAWYYDTGFGNSLYNVKSYGNASTTQLLLVRDGDVMTAAVPEPETYAMLLAGMGVLATMVRRRKA